MKKLLFTFLAITVLSCSSSDDNNPTAVAPNIQLQKMEVRNSRGELTDVVEYSYEDNHLSKSTRLDSDGAVIDSVTYSYTNDQLIKKTDFNDNGGVIEVESFVYNDNKIVSTSYLNYTGVRHYIYNDLGQVIKEQISRNGTTSDAGDCEYNAVGNLVKYTNISGNSSIYYTFDNKKTVASLLYPQAVLKIPVYAVAGNNNNVIRFDHSDGVIYDYEYEYNAAGYPTKKTKKEDGTILEETTYFYSN